MPGFHHLHLTLDLWHIYCISDWWQPEDKYLVNTSLSYDVSCLTGWGELPEHFNQPLIGLRWIVGYWEPHRIHWLCHPNLDKRRLTILATLEGASKIVQTLLALYDVLYSVWKCRLWGMQVLNQDTGTVFTWCRALRLLDEHKSNGWTQTKQSFVSLPIATKIQYSVFNVQKV